MDEIVEIMKEKIQDLKDLNLLKESDKADLVNERIIMVDLLDSKLANKTGKKDVPNGEVLYPVLINGRPEYELRIKKDIKANREIKFLSLMKTKNAVQTQQYLQFYRSVGGTGDVRMLELPYLGTRFFVEDSAEDLEFYNSGGIDFSGNELNKGIPLNIGALNNLIQRFREIK